MISRLALCCAGRSLQMMAYPLKWVEIVYPLPAAGSLAMLQAVCQVASIKREGGMLEPAKYQSSKWEGISPEAAQALIQARLLLLFAGRGLGRDWGSLRCRWARLLIPLMRCRSCCDLTNRQTDGNCLRDQDVCCTFMSSTSYRSSDTIHSTIIRRLHTCEDIEFLCVENWSDT